MTHEQLDPPFDPCPKPKTHTPTHDSFDPRRPTKREQRIENKGRPSDHIGRMTIGPPLPNQNHRRITSIGREKRERKEERTEFGERVVRIKTFFYSNRESNGSGKNEEKEV